jgi:uncharacterized alkaline shock family protein YloU
MEKELGKVTIAPQVLLTIARLTTLATPGVACMSPTLVGSVSRVLRRQRLNEGIRIIVEDDIVYIDLYIIVEPNVGLLELGRQIQHDVTRAINDMLGMHVGEVNIHIQDVVIPALSERPKEEAE